MLISVIKKSNVGEVAEKDWRCVTMLNNVVGEDLTKKVTWKSSGVT